MTTPIQRYSIGGDTGDRHSGTYASTQDIDGRWMLAREVLPVISERDALAAEVARLRECYTECKLDNIVLRERPMSIEDELAFRNKIRASWAESPLPAPPGQETQCISP